MRLSFACKTGLPFLRKFTYSQKNVPTFFYLLTGTSDENVTLDTPCLTMINILKHSVNYTIIWHCLKFDLSLTFWPLTVGLTKRSPWTLLHVWPWWTCWNIQFYDLTLFEIWPFFDLLTPNCRSDKEVTVDTFACLTVMNMLKHWPECTKLD